MSTVDEVPEESRKLDRWGAMLKQRGLWKGERRLMSLGLGFLCTKALVLAPGASLSYGHLKQFLAVEDDQAPLLASDPATPAAVALMLTWKLEGKL